MNASSSRSVTSSGQLCRLNKRLVSFSCIRCGQVSEVADYFEGCSSCLDKGYPASVQAQYSKAPATLAELDARTMKRFAQWLPYEAFPSLGEGGTPLISLDQLASEVGVGRLLIKNEGQNPTGSHKDRMSCFVVARAVDIGAETVIAASSGNAGVSVAAYAAAAGLACEIVTTPIMNPNWRRAIEMSGARLVATNEVAARWTYVQDRVRNDGCYPATNYMTPAVGSNAFGVDGYRTIAFELHEELGAENINAVLVPTSRADLLWGICRGFKDLQEANFVETVPKVHAVEPISRISSVLEGCDYRQEFTGTSDLVSIGGTTVTYQAMHALKLCCGTAVTVNDSGALHDQKILAAQGLYLELSSAAALTGLRRLVERGTVQKGSTVVLIGTSHGFKEHEPTDSSIPIVG